MAKGGYDSVLQYPSTKDITHNDWAEEDGIEPDLSILPLAPKEFSLALNFEHNKEDFSGMVAFLDDLTDDGAFSMVLNEVGMTLSAVRFLGVSSLTKHETCLTATFRFVIDNPTTASATLPTSAVPVDNLFKLGSTPLSAYGVRALKGTVSSTDKPAENKEYLTVESKYLNGQTYLHTGDVFHKERNVTLQCLMTADTLAHFSSCYSAFLYDLTKKDNAQYLIDPTTAYQRTMTLNGTEYQCYYKSQNVTDFMQHDGRVWFRFTLTLTLID